MGPSVGRRAMMDAEQLLGQRLLLSFDGKRQPPTPLLRLVRQGHAAGIVLFRHRNVGTLAELRGLTHALQQAAAQGGQPPLLIAADQEGGQLMAIGDATPFPGNMALGATRSAELTRAVGRAMGRELLALGVNVDFAPVCDVNANPKNPVVGTRSFGDDPALVARLAAAFVRGLQSAGVAATAKHFPGHGDTASDSHHGLPVVAHGPERVRRVELPPFRAAIDAGVRLVMAAHVALPALDPGAVRPATVSPAVLRGLLRRRLGFQGLIVTDAMDMGAIEQGDALAIEALAALEAGADLLLLNHDLARIPALRACLVQAARRALLSPQELQAAARRVLGLRRRLGRGDQPPRAVVGCREHQALAREVAERSVTLVRDRNGLLPLRLKPRARVAVVLPRPEDLTPADTSSQVVPALAQAVRRRHGGDVEEFLFPLQPPRSLVSALSARLAADDLVIVGTINACHHPGQAALVRALVAGRSPVVTVALRLPYDVASYPAAPCALCSYSILPPAMDAVADALFGRIEASGRLPVRAAGLAGSEGRR